MYISGINNTITKHQYKIINNITDTLTQIYTKAILKIKFHFVIPLTDLVQMNIIYAVCKVRPEGSYSLNSLG